MKKSVGYIKHITCNKERQHKRKEKKTKDNYKMKKVRATFNIIYNKERQNKRKEKKTKEIYK